MPTPVKSVLNNPRLKGIHGTIASLIDCDNKFDTNACSKFNAIWFYTVSEYNIE